MKFSFLIHNFYGVGGTNRAVLNLATALVEAGHEVEVASVFRRLDRTMFSVDGRITVVPLVDTRPRRPDRSSPRHREPSTLIPEAEEFHLQYSRLTDERIIRYLGSTNADVVVGTRPGLNLAVARHAPEHAVRVAQEHMTQDLIDEALKAEISRGYSRIDLAYTVTHADATAFRTGNPVPALGIKVLPNSSPSPGLAAADGRNRIVVAAGRLDPIKRYDRLITAFARAAVDCPGWTLRIYGDGEQRQALAALIRELGVYDQVQLMGRRDDMSTEWVKGAIAASSSARESFGMTIVEAMRLGLPVVSTDCPVGPREIIDDGEDGLLVPSDDLDAYTAALRTLMRDDDLRARMAKMALVNSARFDPAPLAAQFADDCAEVLAVRRGETPRPRRVVRRTPRRGLSRSLLARGGELLREPDLVRTLADPVLRGIAGNDLARRASMGVLVRLARVQRARGASSRLQNAIRRRVFDPAGGPVADCVVEPDLGLRWTFDAATCSRDASMVLRNRDTVEVVRVPLTPSHDGLQFVGILDADALSEGRWNVHLVDGKVRRRVRPHQLDSRVLASGVDGCAAENRRGVRAHLPYRTTDGFLAVRSWVRGSHAEVRRVELDGQHITVAFTWHGPDTPECAVLRRRGDQPESLTVPTRTTADGTLWMAVPLYPLADLRLSRYEDWDIQLRQRDGSEVRLGRFVDDVVDKKRTYNYPEVHLSDDVTLDLVEEDPTPMLRVRPYYTIDSELSVVVVDRP
ncbi:glycosyltransferase family 4 protein [Micromonospora sp. 4G57]|uniref:Glycosyltransferase family 4 protein n=1 Tax=Micromonospora sicca TaxID=2202420 RepID=A0ABU5J7V7_9ACTN|nr:MULTISPECIES: glycosyltransferase family 4 protein [unclassified Micromonospora]MDZ5443260.1 glycosyltransferase family 4 protein [Micromonospora sp. 4G57]MDZ5488623.1 glycosyltransferase family 4 protein [Micromonospora sp. 4G53]